MALPNMQRLNNNFLFSRDPVFAEKVIIENPNSHIFLIGDIHSSIHSLLDIMINLRNRNVFNRSDTFIINSNCYIFFLGDLVDRGPYSIEVLSFVLLLKIHNKNNVFIINGNHEDYETYGVSGNIQAGLIDEISQQFGIDNNESKEIHSLMHAFPSVIYLKFVDKLYHLSHGAILSPSKIVIDIKEWINSSDKKFMLIEFYNPNNSLKWGDLKMSLGYEEANHLNHGRPNFGYDKIDEYCNYLGVSSLITGHQDMENLMIQPKRYVKDEIINGKKNKKIHSVNLPSKHSNVILPSNIDLGSIKYGYTKFVHCKTHYHLCEYPYDLYSIFSKGRKSNIVLNATKDFYSITTSTATISKGLEYNCYLELYLEELPDQQNMTQSLQNINLSSPKSKLRPIKRPPLRKKLLKSYEESNL